MTVTNETEVLEAFNRLFLGLFFTFVALFYTTLILWRNKIYRRPMVHPGRRFTLHWWNHVVFRVFRVAIWGVCVARIFFPQSVDAAIRVYSLPGYFYLLGDAMLLAGFGLAVMAGLQLNGQWRSGIDHQRPTTLVTEGVYRLSRNPIYVGVVMAQMGFLLALPSVFSLVCLMVGWIAIYIQVILEERHLREQHRNHYIDYCRQVSRWFTTH